MFSIRQTFNRRTFIAQASTVAAGALIVSCGSTVPESQPSNLKNTDNKTTVPSDNKTTASSDTLTNAQLPLGYAYDALEPYIDAKTMETHYSKHHATYVKNLSDALKDEPLATLPLPVLLSRLNELPEKKRAIVRNNGGGHANHTLFWEIMTPGGSKQPVGDLASGINTSFGSFDAFKTAFEDAGKKLFGSGWIWLTIVDGKLTITGMPNQDSPLLDGQLPIMGNDVWEHAYYLKYQNRRPDYLKAWWNVVNWDKVAARYEQVKKV